MLVATTLAAARATSFATDAPPIPTITTKATNSAMQHHLCGKL